VSQENGASQGEKTHKGHLPAGAPRKIPRDRSRPPAISTHKARAAWFNARAAWPQREAPVTALTAARVRAAEHDPPPGGPAVWEEAGPANVGGRASCLVLHPDRPERIWLGSAGGGVWFSDDGGVEWTALWHSEATLNIGSLCLDPTDPDTIYCGTGEANMSADSHTGLGLFRSRDGGSSWGLLAPSEESNIPRRIGRIAVDPADPDHLFLCGVGHQPDHARGIYRSRDGGRSWSRVAGILEAPYQGHDILFHPGALGVLYAAIHALGPASGISQSTD